MLKNKIDFDQILKLINEFGPSRVVMNSEGVAIPPLKASKHHIDPDIIFIRNDGWTLGAPKRHEKVAYNLWSSDWVGFIRKEEGTIHPITEYKSQ